MAFEQDHPLEKNSRRDLRFPVPFEQYYGRWGLIQIGPVLPDTEYTGVPGKVGPQKRDPVTGEPVWKIAVTDPGEPNSRRASYDLYLLSDSEPAPTTPEIAPGVRPISLVGLTVQPRVAGQGEFKYLAYTVRATGYAPAPNGRGGNAGTAGGSGKSPA
ncbi:hypothetical protein [Nocardia tengchongensis]